MLLASGEADKPTYVNQGEVFCKWRNKWVLSCATKALFGVTLFCFSNSTLSRAAEAEMSWRSICWWVLSLWAAFRPLILWHFSSCLVSCRWTPCQGEARVLWPHPGATLAHPQVRPLSCRVAPIRASLFWGLLDTTRRHSLQLCLIRSCAAGSARQQQEPLTLWRSCCAISSACFYPFTHPLFPWPQLPSLARQ